MDDVMPEKPEMSSLRGQRFGGFPLSSADWNSADAPDTCKAGSPLFRALLAEFPGCVVRVDRFGKVIHWDCGRESSFDFRGGEWIGKSLDRLFSSADGARVRSRLEHLARGDADDTTLIVTGVNLDGVAEPLSLRFLPFERRTTHDGHDSQICTVLICRPSELQDAGEIDKPESALADLAESQRLTERRLKRRALELARSNAELRRFAYVASHDMKEPLRMVSMYVQLLRKKHGDKLDDSARDLIQGAVDAISRIYGLIDALLDYSQAGRDQVPAVPVDLNAVVADSLENLRAAVQEAGAIVHREALPTVHASRPALVRLFQNLIGNALKFRNKGRTPVVTVDCQHAGSHVVFSVSDNGIGISPEYSEKVFEIFQRLHAPHQYPGSGIGLAVCKKIVEQHGGRIWFESSVGEGTTFYFSLLRNHTDHALAPNIPWESA